MDDAEYTEPGICETCGTDIDVDYVINPYIQDIQGISVMEWMCVDCYNSAVGDI